MKNIHLLATGKASRIHFYNYLSNLGLSKDYLHWRDGKVIYITSDEEIKLNDYITDGYYVWQWKDNSSLLGRKKIILTTDQDLIKHGIQAIDDEFLEWFVKNQSCDEVDVIHSFMSKQLNKPISKLYKIIIPKEELKMTECYFAPKKDTSSSTICSNCGQEKFLHTIGLGVKISTYIINPKEEFKQEFVNTMPMFKIEPKQETLEEAAEKYAEKFYPDAYSDFIEGAKWQAKRMYSEEDINKLLDTLLQNNMCSVAGDELIEQFKKK